jgi:hypothetical protein
VNARARERARARHARAHQASQAQALARAGRQTPHHPSPPQLTIVAFKRSGLAVKAHAWDRDLGGRDLDELLYSALADDFKVWGV